MGLKIRIVRRALQMCIHSREGNNHLHFCPLICIDLLFLNLKRNIKARLDMKIVIF